MSGLEALRFVASTLNNDLNAEIVAARAAEERAEERARAAEERAQQAEARAEQSELLSRHIMDSFRLIFFGIVLSFIDH